MKYKIGDKVVGIKDDPDYPDRKIVGRIGVVTFVWPFYVEYPYTVEFNLDRDNLRESQIKLYLNKLKLKKLLED